MTKLLTHNPTPARSATMRAVKSRDTKPELLVRRLLRPIAPGYRLNRSDIPGKPDIAFIGAKRAIFVHGCFWHGHACKRGARAPRDNSEYWTAKIARNRARDAAHLATLERAGWRVLTVWECELRDVAEVSARLRKFLE
jgi:DNA mismatch endonuclease (patch repair protein)